MRIENNKSYLYATTNSCIHVGLRDTACIDEIHGAKRPDPFITAVTIVMIG